MLSGKQTMSAMITTAIVLFLLAAIIGMVLLSFVLKGKKPSQALVLTHGPLALAGIVLVIAYSAQNSAGPMDALILFIITASGGIILVMHDLMGKAIPKWLGVLHGLMAVAGFICLLMFQFR